MTTGINIWSGHGRDQLNVITSFPLSHQIVKRAKDCRQSFDKSQIALNLCSPLRVMVEAQLCVMSRNGWLHYTVSIKSDWWLPHTIVCHISIIRFWCTLYLIISLNLPCYVSHGFVSASISSWRSKECLCIRSRYSAPSVYSRSRSDSTRCIGICPWIQKFSFSSLSSWVAAKWNASSILKQR